MLKVESMIRREALWNDVEWLEEGEVLYTQDLVVRLLLKIKERHKGRGFYMEIKICNIYAFYSYPTTGINTSVGISNRWDIARLLQETRLVIKRLS